MNIHIVCPFYRVRLLPTLIHYLEPMGIQWHPVIAPGDEAVFDRDWIHPLQVPPLRPRDQCFRKLNDFIDTYPIEDEDYYGFMGDDDMYEPGFFDVIRQQTAEILMCSLSRGDTVPADPHASPHPVFPLIIKSASDVKVCAIGLPQYLMRGRILRQTRFANQVTCDDGYYAEGLVQRFPNDIVYLPDLFVFGNFFQPGRYTKKEALLKPHWDLPIFPPGYDPPPSRRHTPSPSSTCTCPPTRHTCAQSG